MIGHPEPERLNRTVALPIIEFATEIKFSHSKVSTKFIRGHTNFTYGLCLQFAAKLGVPG